MDRETFEVKVGDEVVTFTEPDMLGLLKMVNALVELDGVADESGHIEMRALLRVLTGRPPVLASVLESVSDHDAAWYLEPGRIKGDEFMRLIAGAMHVIPFRSLLRAFNEMAETFAAQFAGISGESPTS